MAMTEISSTISLNSTIVVLASADLYLGAPQFQLQVDGQPVGSVQTVTAVHRQGAWQEFTFTSNFGSSGPSKIEVVYLNDLWGGSVDTDRNLYIDKITVNSTVYETEKVAVYDRTSGADLTGTETMNYSGK